MTSRVRRLKGSGSVSFALALAFAGCGESASSSARPTSASGEFAATPASGGSPASAGPTLSSHGMPSPTPSLKAEVVCQPSPTNACVGDLAPGRHASSLFQPALSVNVPEGWSNHEDERRGYVVYAPGSIPPGSEYGARDKIAILPDVATTPKGCTAPGPDAGESAHDIAQWMATREHLRVSAPAPVSAWQVLAGCTTRR